MNGIGQANPSRPGRWATLAWLLGLMLAVFVIEQDVELMLWDAHAMPGAGKIGIKADPAPQVGPGFVEVYRVDPGLPADEAGIAIGDDLRFDYVHDYDRLLMKGETVGFTRLHKGRTQHMMLTAAPPGPANAEAVGGRELFYLSSIIPALFGLFILWRSRGRPAAPWLGLALATFGWTSTSVGMIEARPAVYVLFSAINYAGYAAMPVAFLVFALRFYAETVGRVPRWGWALLAAYGVLDLASVGALGWGALTASTLPVVGDGQDVATTMILLGLVAVLPCLAIGLRRSRRDIRQRYVLLVIAISAVLAAQAIQSANSFFVQDPKWFSNRLLYVAEALSGLAAPLLFAYAILKQRVLDVGFAVNRTLVYGCVSVVLLVSFGLIEWGSEKIIPARFLEGPNKDWLDAAVALAIFLTFHRVRDLVEKVIEHLFFGSWRRNEAALRQFVAEAGFIGRSEALMRALRAELQRFSGGAEVALYVVGKNASAVRAEGAVSGFDKVIDSDHSLLVSLRATRHTKEVGGGLALPMHVRMDLTGLVLLGPKPTGEAYRPDEREVLGWAVQQTGLDLHGLRVEHLEHSVASVRRKAATLQAQLKLAMKLAKPE